MDTGLGGTFCLGGQDHLGQHVAPLVGVDHHLAHGALLQLLQLLLGLQPKRRLPERVFHPGAAHLVDVHSQTQLIGGYLLEHGLHAGPGTAGLP